MKKLLKYFAKFSAFAVVILVVVILIVRYQNTKENQIVIKQLHEKKLTANKEFLFFLGNMWKDGKVDLLQRCYQITADDIRIGKYEEGNRGDVILEFDYSENLNKLLEPTKVFIYLVVPDFKKDIDAFFTRLNLDINSYDITTKSCDTWNEIIKNTKNTGENTKKILSLYFKKYSSILNIPENDFESFLKEYSKIVFQRYVNPPSYEHGSEREDLKYLFNKIIIQKKVKITEQELREIFEKLDKLSFNTHVKLIKK